METPKIYVADLAAYNEGKLVGEWLDLSDFDSGSDVVEAINDLLKKFSEEQGVEREEYAIHDTENIPEGFIDESSGEDDIDRVIQVYKKAEEEDLPLDVLLQYADEVGMEADELDDVPFVGRFDDESDFAYDLVEQGAGGDLSSYLYMTATDMRLYAQEEADNRVDDMDDDDILDAVDSDIKDELDRAEEIDDEIKEKMEEIESLNDEIEELESGDEDTTEGELEENASEIESIKGQIEELNDSIMELSNERRDLNHTDREDEIDECREILREKYYDEIHDELESDAVAYFIDNGLYTEEDIQKSNLFRIDYEQYAKDLSDSYTYIRYDGDTYVFSLYKRGGMTYADGGIIDGNKIYEYGITYELVTPESAEHGDFEETGWEVERHVATLEDILREASYNYGISEPTDSFHTSWSSQSPDNDRDYYEKGHERYYTLFVNEIDGSEISKEEADFITEKLRSGLNLYWDREDKVWWADGGMIGDRVDVKDYSSYEYYNSLDQAKERADKLRGMGYEAIVTKSDSGYEAQHRVLYKKKGISGYNEKRVYDDGGMMAKGGMAKFKKGLSSIASKTKELAKKGVEKTKEGYGKAKKYTKDKIRDQKKKVALEVIDDTKDKVGNTKDKIILKASEELVKNKYEKGGTLEAKMKKKLSESLELPMELAIYVPSTDKANIIISKKDFQNRIEEVERFLSDLFGGYSAVSVDGGYVSEDKGLIQEDVTRVATFGSIENFESNFERLINKIGEWCNKWGQESMGFEFEDDMFYIDKNTTFSRGGTTDMPKKKD